MLFEVDDVCIYDLSKFVFVRVVSKFWIEEVLRSVGICIEECEWVSYWEDGVSRGLLK